MGYRKKLIEVALPLKAINEASAKEKSIRHGHPSTLHLWWARRPLAACRAVLFASLVDDPDSDPMYAGAGEDIAGQKRAELFNLIEELVQWENSNNARVINRARAEIARSIAANKVADGEWKNDQVLELSAVDLQADNDQSKIQEPKSKTPCPVRDIKNMLALPEAVNAFLAEHAPPVLDPFCGGGSIPLEAQRLGLRAYASDLNPVPVLITKALIEIPPKFAGRPPVNPEWQQKSAEEKAARVWQGAQGLAEDVRYYGKWMRDEAFKRIGHLYPKGNITAEIAQDRPDIAQYVGQELTVIAWLWARTVASPNPACQGATVPLVSSLLLSGKSGKNVWAEIVPTENGNDGWNFRIHAGEMQKDALAAAKLGTKAGKAKDFICALTKAPISRAYIQAEGKADRLGARLMAIVCEGPRGRVYVPPNDRAEEAATMARSLGMAEVAQQSFLAGATPTRAMITGGVCSAYGLRTWAHLFTPRQIVALMTFSDVALEARAAVAADSQKAQLLADPRRLTDGGSGALAYADAVATYLALAVSKAADRNSALCSWESGMDRLRSTFGRQGFPMVWDYAETNPFADAAGDIFSAVDTVAKVIDRLPLNPSCARVSQLDATSAADKDNRSVVSTDPPYYDNIGYAELSDYFYAWLRRSLKNVYPSLFATALTPKAQELTVSPYRHEGDRQKAQHFFEEGLQRAFAQMHSAHAINLPLTVYYAFKQAETEETVDDDSGGRRIASTGWETMLAGLIASGFAITGTWPMRTEAAGRMVGLGANALASSIVLVCRPRPDDAPLARRKDFMNALRAELPEALRNLQHGNIAPVDLAQAAIGPGMAVFTRYAKVVEADGSAMSVRAALGIINQVLDEVLAEQEGEFDPDTRWALAWFAEHGMNEGPFGVAETLSKAKNTAVAGLVEAGVVKARGGKVKLVSRGELPADWDPGADARLTVWETTQHLIRALETQGESGAAALLARLGGIGETARELAYRLYTLCERKKWADEALAYNGLVIAWPELTKLAHARRNADDTVQKEIFG